MDYLLDAVLAAISMVILDKKMPFRHKIITAMVIFVMIVLFRFFVF